MALKRVNLEDKLRVLKNRETTQEDILSEVNAIFKCEEEKERQIEERLEIDDFAGENKFNIDLLESNRIFHISHIKNICIAYRLRFLPTKYFKMDLPPEAIFAIKDLEKEHNLCLGGFKIVAPSKSFKLENADDPLLFAPIGNGYYYLIHKWGRDLHPLRKLMMWPFRNLENIAIFSLIFSFLFTFGIRELFFTQYRATSEFIMLFMFTFKSVIGLILFYGIALGKNFNSGIWRSKYIS